jgi:hypothetical protein
MVDLISTFVPERDAARIKAELLAELAAAKRAGLPRRELKVILQKLAAIDGPAVLPDHEALTHPCTYLRNGPLEGVGLNGKTITATAKPVPAEEIDRRNGWVEPGEIALTAPDFKDPADALALLLRWLAAGPLTLKTAGLRTFAVLLALRSDLLPPDANNGSTLAKRLGVTRAALSQRVAGIFKLANGKFSRGQCCKPAVVRERNRQAALRHHRAAGHRVGGKSKPRKALAGRGVELLTVRS